MTNKIIINANNINWSVFCKIRNYCEIFITNSLSCRMFHQEVSQMILTMTMIFKTHVGRCINEGPHKPFAKQNNIIIISF